MTTTTRHMDNLARAEARYEAARDAVFTASDVLADYLEDGGALITDLTPGLTRMCSQFINLRTAVEQVQEAANELSMFRLIADYYETED